MFPINEVTELHFLKVYTLIISWFFPLWSSSSLFYWELLFFYVTLSFPVLVSRSLYLNPYFFTHIPIEKLTSSPSHLSVLLISKMINQILTFDIPSFSSSRVVFCIKNCWQSCVQAIYSLASLGKSEYSVLTDTHFWLFEVCMSSTAQLSQQSGSTCTRTYTRYLSSPRCSDPRW